MPTLEIELDFKTEKEMESFKKDFERKFNVKKSKGNTFTINNKKKVK